MDHHRRSASGCWKVVELEYLGLGRSQISEKGGKEFYNLRIYKFYQNYIARSSRIWTKTGHSLFTSLLQLSDKLFFDAFRLPPKLMAESAVG